MFELHSCLYFIHLSFIIFHFELCRKKGREQTRTCEILQFKCPAHNCLNVNRKERQPVGQWTVNCF